MNDNQFLTAARSGRNESWRYVVTVVLVVALMITSGVCLVVGTMALTGSLDVTKLPALPFLILNLLPFPFAIIGLWIGVRLLHGRPFLSLVNPVEGRFNAGRFFLSALVWLIILVTGDLILAQLQPGNYVFHFDAAQFLSFLAVALLLIPLQSGAEELFFRGYLTQGMGLVGGFWAAWLVPSILFGLLHSANPEVSSFGWLLTIPIYIGMGLLAGWITLRSESLELALGLHIVNNLYGAVAVGYPSSALPSTALFTIQTYHPLAALVAGLIQMALYLLLMNQVGRAFFRKGLLSSLALLLIVSGCAPSATVVSPKEKSAPGIPFSDCYLSIAGQVQVSAQCGKLTVLEDPAAPAGRKIDLRVVVVKAVSRTPAPDALLLLAGGPGQAASEAYTLLLPYLDRLRFKHDLILVDQRGTGQSNPLDCADPEQPHGDQVIGQQISLPVRSAELAKCRAGLPGDPRFYTTDFAMRDLEQVRAALGYPQVDLLGVSYGTRAALAYLRLFPERVRTVILDGVVPPGWPLGADMAPDAQRALDLVFQRCEQDDACHAAFPDLREEFQGLLAQAASHPAEVSVVHPSSGRPTRMIMTRDTLGQAVRLMTYSDLLAALLPLGIHSAAHGDYQLIAGQYLQMMDELNNGMSIGMYYSVVCAEDTPNLPAQPPSGSFYLDYSFEETRALCQTWLGQPAGQKTPGGQSAPADVEYRQDVPVLLISGEADPVTPPENGEAVTKLLPNSRHLVLSGLGHNNFYTGCMPDILFNFVETASIKTLDTTCTTKIHPQPFFLSPAGPKP